jgi:hypothetical protein
MMLVSQQPLRMIAIEGARNWNVSWTGLRSESWKTGRSELGETTNKHQEPSSR